MPALQDNERDIFLKLNSIVRSDPSVFNEEEHRLFNQVKQLYVQSILSQPNRVMPSVMDEQTEIPTAPLKVGSQPAYNIENQAFIEGEPRAKEFLRKLPAGARGFASGVLFAVQPNEWANAVMGLGKLGAVKLADALEKMGMQEGAQTVRENIPQFEIPAVRLPESASMKPEDQLVEALVMAVTDLNVVAGVAKRIRMVKGEKAANEFMANYRKAVKELEDKKLLPSGERKALPEGAPITYAEGEGVVRSQQKLAQRTKGVKVPKQKPKVQKAEAVVKEPPKTKTGESPKILDTEGQGWRLSAEDKIIIQKAKDKQRVLTGEQFTKGLFKAAKEDIISPSSGVVADPYRNLKQFLKENKARLTDEEMAKL